MAVGSIQHEFLHALGAVHTHVRPDRDDYVEIDEENIKEEGKKQYAKGKDKNINQFNMPYDYDSLMHYSAYSYAKDRKKPVITAKDAAMQDFLGRNGERVSEGDIRLIKKMYGCSAARGKRSGAGCTVKVSSDGGSGANERYDFDQGAPANRVDIKRKFNTFDSTHGKKKIKVSGDKACAVTVGFEEDEIVQFKTFRPDTGRKVLCGPNSNCVVLSVTTGPERCYYTDGSTANFSLPCLCGTSTSTTNKPFCNSSHGGGQGEISDAPVGSDSVEGICTLQTFKRAIRKSPGVEFADLHPCRAPFQMCHVECSAGYEDDSGVATCDQNNGEVSQPVSCKPKCTLDKFNEAIRGAKGVESSGGDRCTPSAPCQRFRVKCSVGYEYVSGERVATCDDGRVEQDLICKPRCTLLKLTRAIRNSHGVETGLLGMILWLGTTDC